MLKIPYCFEKNYKKSPSSAEVPLPDPSWPPVAGGSVFRPPSMYDLTHTYITVLQQNFLSLSPF